MKAEQKSVMLYKATFTRGNRLVATIDRAACEAIACPGISRQGDISYKAETVTQVVVLFTTRGESVQCSMDRRFGGVPVLIETVVRSIRRQHKLVIDEARLLARSVADNMVSDSEPPAVLTAYSGIFHAISNQL